MPQPTSKDPAADAVAPTQLLVLRVALPTTLALGGIVVLLAGLTDIGIVLLVTAAIAVFVDFFARLTISSDVDREQEAEARQAFRRTGRWPRRR